MTDRPGQRDRTACQEPAIRRSRSEMAERGFTATSEAVAAARRFAADCLKTWGRRSDEVVLVVSELATNAVVHAGTEWSLRIRWDGAEGVRIEVTDEAGGRPQVVANVGDGPGGRGLLIVSRVAEAWGTSFGSGSKVVWADLALR